MTDGVVERPTMALMRPLLMLVAAAAASLAMWHLLMVEPWIPTGERGRVLAHQESRALEP